MYIIVLWYNVMPNMTLYHNACIPQLASWRWTLMAQDMQTSVCEIKIKTRVHSVALIVITIKQLAKHNRSKSRTVTTCKDYTCTIHVRIVQLLNLELLKAGTCQHAHTCTHYPTCLHAHNYT